MENLLPYYERELIYLRRLGREFQERYPGVGGKLQLGQDTCPDPHVEQLIESVALLSARVAKRLDDSFPELTEALLEALFPHYLRPFPSCSIMQAAHAATTTAAAPPLTIARGAELDSAPVDGVRCRFKTAYDIALTPLSIASARFLPLARAPAGVALPAAAGSAISIGFEGEVPAGLKALRVFIDGEPAFCAALRDALFMRGAGAWVEAPPGRWTALPAPPLAPVGFAEDEALVPFDARSQLAYRVLAEYFMFPEKFHFFDIDLAPIRARLPAGCRRFALHLALAGLRPDAPAARLLASLSGDNLLLGCSPVVNLFQRPGHPVAVTHETADYGVLADAAQPQAYEVVSIDAVRMVRKHGQRQSVTEFQPFYALRHGERASGKGYYWTARDDAVLAVTSPGHEKRITLTDADFHPLTVGQSSLSIDLSCTNRDLPHALAYGKDGELTPLRDADSYTARLLRKPTRSRRWSARDGQHWRLISHLTLNQHALSQGGLPALHEMLALYDLTRSAASRRRIDGVTGLEQRETVTWLRHRHGAELVHGTEVRMTLDEEAYAGGGLLLFVEVIDQFLGLYAQVNSFIELVVLSMQSGKELMRCKPRSGHQKLT